MGVYAHTRTEYEMTIYFIEYDSGYRMIYPTFGMFLNALARVVTLDEEDGNLFEDRFKAYGRVANEL